MSASIFARHSGRDCRNPVAMEGKAKINKRRSAAQVTFMRDLLPCSLESGNPCRNDSEVAA